MSKRNLLSIVFFLVVSGIVFFEFIYTRAVVGVIQLIDNTDVFYVDASGTKKVSIGEEPFHVVVQLAGTEERIEMSSADPAWSALRSGDCVRASMRPYAFWRGVQKIDGHKARVVEKIECSSLNP